MSSNLSDLPFNQEGPFLEEEYPGEYFQGILGPAGKLPGWPGYRTRPGRSGYDPLDSDFEAAHMEGVILRKLLTGQPITDNPLYWLGMGFFALIGLFPLAISLIEVLAGNQDYLYVLIHFLPYEALGIGLLLNIGLSISRAVRERKSDQP